MTINPSDIPVKVIVNLLETAHKAGFMSGRQAASEYVRHTLNVGAPLSKERTESYFETQRLRSLGLIVKAFEGESND